MSTRNDFSSVPTLTVGNFEEWHRKMKMVVSAKGIHHRNAWEGKNLRGMLGDETETEYNKYREEAEQAEYWVLLQINLHIDDTNQLLISDKETPFSALESLRTHHKSTSAHQVVSILQQLFTKKLLDGEDPREHLKTMRELQTKLTALTSGSQDSVLKDLALPDKVVALLLLSTLPSSFSTIRTLLIDDLPTLSTTKVYTKLEAELATNSQVSSEPSSSSQTIKTEALYTRTSPPSSKSPSKSSNSTNNPTSSSSSPSSPQPRKERAKCSYCGRGTHTAEDCFKRKADRLDELEKKEKERGGSQVLAGSVSLPPTQSSTPQAGRSFSVVIGEQDDRNDFGISEGFIVQLLSSFTSSGKPPSSLVDTLKLYLDSGAGAHMVDREEILHHLRQIQPVQVKLANGSLITVTKAGCLDLVTPNSARYTLRNVLVVPGLAVALISVGALVRSKTLKVVFDGHSAEVLSKDLKPILSAVCEEGSTVFTLNVRILPPIPSPHLPANSITLLELHRRCGHVGISSLRRMTKSKYLEGVEVVDDGAASGCEFCAISKAVRLPYSVSESLSKNVGDLVHSDVCGPFPPSLGGKKYFVTFIDDASRRAFVYFMKEKSEVPEKMREFLDELELNGFKLRELRSDNGGEYVGKGMKELAKSRGFRLHTTAPYSPQQNGVAERYNRVLQEHTTLFLQQSGLSKSFWAEATALANNIRSIVPHSRINYEAPLSFWPEDRTIPSFDLFRPFGCAAYARLPDHEISKLDTRGRQCINLGFNRGTKAYRLWDPVKRCVRVLRDVKFNEQLFPAYKPPIFPSHNSPETTLHKFISPNPFAPIATEEDESDDEEEEEVEQEREKENDRRNLRQAQNEGEQREEQGDRGVPQQGEHVEQGELHNEGAEQEEEEEARPRRNVPRLDYRRLHAHGLDAHSASITQSLTPRQALSGPNADEWKQSIQREFDNLQRNDTFDLVPRPSDAQVIRSHLVLREKKNEKGEVIELKSRCVADGRMQREGIDYEELYASVGNSSTLRILYSLAASLDLDIEQFDISGAFLGAAIDRTVYVSPPSEFELPPGKENYCFKLKKSLYGLKQSPRLWQQRFEKELTSIGFTKSKNDPGLYLLRRNSSSFLYLYLHVDDGEIFSSDKSLTKLVRNHLERAFKTKWNSNPTFYLGLVVSRNREKGLLTLSQKPYLLDVLERFGMSDCNPALTPVLPEELTSGSSEDIEAGKNLPLGQLVGSLLYASCWTRPDISAAVGRVASFVGKPTPAAWRAAKHILRYLKGTLDFGLVYSKSPEQLNSVYSYSVPPSIPSTSLNAYSDADWAGCLLSRRSTTGNVVFLGNGVIDWTSRKQQTVSTSTPQAEYQALAETGMKVTWLRKILAELGFPQSTTTVRGDNQGSISMANGTGSHKYTRHVDIKYHYIKELVEDKTVKIEYISTRDMVADIMTKGLGRDLHARFRDAMGVLPIFGRGGVLEVKE